MASPGTLLAQYQVDMSSLSKAELGDLYGLFLAQGFALICQAAGWGITASVNDKKTVSTVSFVGGVLFLLYDVHLYYVAIPVADELKIPLDGMYVNIGLFAVLGKFV